MIVVLTGSPNKKGNTNTVINDLLAGLDEEIYYFDAYQDKISACTDCKFCSYKSGCSQKDNMYTIYDLLEKADALIIASPLYFATMSGELINLLSRFQTYYSGKYVRKVANPHVKKGLLLVTAGGYWPSMFVGVKETFHIMKLLFGIEETRELLIPKCDDVKPTESDVYQSNKNKIRQFLSETNE